MKKNEIKPEIQAQLDTLNKRMGKLRGATALAKLGERTKNDPTAAQYAIGDKLSIIDDEKNLFIQSIGTNGAAGCSAVCVGADGKESAKAIYFSALSRSVAEYGEDLQPTGNVVYAKTDEVHDVYDAAYNSATDLEVWNAIKGKTLEIVDIKTVVGARYNAANQVIGVRKRNVPVFKFA